MGELDAGRHDAELPQRGVEVAVPHLDDGNQPTQLRPYLDVTEQDQVFGNCRQAGCRALDHSADEVPCLGRVDRGHAEPAKLIRQRCQETADPMRSIGRNLLEPEKSVDDEALHAATPYGLEEPVAERVEDVLGRRVPEHLQMALLDQAVELNADAGRLNPQAQRRLVKAEKEPGILGGRLRKKMQTEARLS